jgi:carboxyl-terminal processing protease
MDGMVAVLRERGDLHSQFLDEAEADRLRNEIHQQIGGIGVRIGIVGDRPLPVIAGPIDPTTPAGKAKLAPGDRILEINGRPTTGLSRSDVVRKLAGERGTTLLLSIKSPRESQQRTVQLVRDLIQTESVLGDRRAPDGHWIFALESDPRIGLVRCTTFGDRTTTEFANVLEKLTEEGVQGIVLDLRDNAGGALGSAVSVCEMLLPAGKTIVETRGRGQVLRQHYATKTDGAYRELPIVVIVNQNSASASEIVAACLQDHGRAKIVGQRSFGKGTVQQMLPLGKSLLKLTWASFWRPSGANIHRTKGATTDAIWGVVPDAGCERILSTDEYRAFRKYRRRRDQSDIVALGAADSDPSDSFTDEQLQLAANCLQRQIDDKR